MTLDSYLSLLDQAGKAGLPELMLQLPSPDVTEARAWLDPLQHAAEWATDPLTDAAIADFESDVRLSRGYPPT